ncbi:DUF6890 family protein [Phocoenobacter skyensis]
MALRRHYLPNETDSDHNLARALWLHKQSYENLANAVTNGISQAFSK